MPISLELAKDKFDQQMDLLKIFRGKNNCFFFFNFYCSCILDCCACWFTRKEAADGSLQALLKDLLDLGSLIPRRKGGVRRQAGLRPGRLGAALPLPPAPPNFPQEVWFNERIWEPQKRLKIIAVCQRLANLFPPF